MSKRLTQAQGLTGNLALQTALLDLDGVIRSIDRWVATIEPDSDETPAELPQLWERLRKVYEAFDPLASRSPEHLAILPRWLMPAAPDDDGPVVEPGGLGLLDQRIQHPSGGWVNIVLEMGNDDRWSLQNMVDRWRSLAVPEPEPVASPQGQDDAAVWVPVVDPGSHNGLLVRLTFDCAKASTAEPPRVVSATDQVSDKFRSGVARGLAAALAVAERLGVPADERAAWSHLTIREVDGGRATTQLDDFSAGGPIALEVLRRLLKLPIPDTMTSGAVAPFEQLSVLDADGYAAKAQAARERGFGLLRLEAPWV